MRRAIIGAYFTDDPERRRAFVLASSQLTHRGWQAETAAMAVAECVALAVQTGQRPEVKQVLGCLRRLSNQGEWQELWRRVESSIGENQSIAEFVRTLGLNRGVTGYSLHVVPVAIYAWMLHPGNFRKALISAMNCGGDTDTVGAIAGAMLGASVGEKGIPTEWRDGIWEWPRSVAVMEQIADRLARQRVSQTAVGPTTYFWPGLIARNALFLIIVLAHGFGRLFSTAMTYASGGPDSSRIRLWRATPFNPPAARLREPCSPAWDQTGPAR